MQVKIKKLHKDAVIPKYSKIGDAGMDLVATSKRYEKQFAGGQMQIFGTSIAIEIPHGYVGLIFPRSSVSKTALTLANSVGVIDSGYRGEIIFKFRIDPDSRPTKESSYKIGDRIGQLVIIPYPQIEFKEVDELSATERQFGSFGSTGL